MYRAFFGLGEAPFRITPDPRFLHLDAAVEAALAAVTDGITRHAGLILLVGEVGTGKTTLVRRLLDSLPPAIRTVLVLHPTVGFEEILDHILLELGVPVSGGGPDALLERLAEFAREHARDGGTVAIFFDEAQALRDSTFAALPRLLDLVADDGRPAVQVVLSGQPELDARLTAFDLAPLQARVRATARLAPLTPEGVAAYVRARLVLAQARDPDLFTADALERLAAHSQGVPRVINVLCESALVAAFAEGQPRVTGPLIDAVWADYAPLHDPRGTPMPEPAPGAEHPTEPGEEEESRRPPRRLALAAAVVALIALVPLLTTLLRRGAPPPPAVDVTPTTPAPPVAEPPAEPDVATAPTEAAVTTTTVPEPETDAIATRVAPPSALDAITLVDRFWRAYGARDADAVRALFAPDAAPTGPVLDVDPTGGGALVTPASGIEAKPVGDRVTVRVPFQLSTHDDRGRPVRRQGVASVQVATREGSPRIVALSAEAGPVPRR
jgi:type II secretory pathway predicted ATPase ExeA